MLRALTILFFIYFCNGTNKQRYDRYQVFQSHDRIPMLEPLIEEMKISNQHLRAFSDDASSILVHPDWVEPVKEKLKEKKFNFEVVIKNLQRNIDEEIASNLHFDKNNWFASYHPLNEILSWLNMQVKNCGSRCSLIDIGKSYEGRPLRVLKLTGKKPECKKKQSIWIDSGIHAREWISHTTNMYIIDQLISNYSNDTLVKQLRDDYDWYFLVTMNPDGYEYSWKKDRLWRKSRKPNINSDCIGTDINRNFDFKWLTIGASDNPCSESFAGPKAFSEPEAYHVAEFIKSNHNAWVLAITLHSYGHLWMCPWGYTTDKPSNFLALERVGKEAVKAIFNTNQVEYRFGQASTILYASSGTFRDWAAYEPIPFVYTVELRNKDSFVLPPTEIVPVGREIWDGIKASVNAIRREVPPTCNYKLIDEEVDYDK